jgi:hypothetical protein
MPENKPADGKGKSRSDVIKSNYRTCCTCGVVPLLLLVLIFIAPCLNARRIEWMRRAKATLSELGEAMSAYRDSNNDHTYASFQALKDSGFIESHKSLDNITPKYFLTWDFSNVSTSPTEEFPTSTVGTFQIIAYPRDTRPGFLKTFAITEDQIVREYNPNDNDLTDVKTWDPIL